MAPERDSGLRKASRSAVHWLSPGMDKALVRFYSDSLVTPAQTPEKFEIQPLLCSLILYCKNIFCIYLPILPLNKKRP
jgi:hypothetical protein